MYRPHRFSLLLLAALALPLGACSNLQQLSRIGKAPDMSPMETPVNLEGRDATFANMVTMPPANLDDPSTRNSLWRAGTRHFFKDPRASRIGDILTVEISINDSAKVDNTTKRSRTNGADAAISSFPFGLHKSGDLVNLGSNNANTGTGTVDRKENIRLTVAAVVTGLLPNGNLIIQGRQEVRVNFEVRDLTVAGIVRPEDITADNRIQHTQIAEARISYGGRGQITDVQQAPYGQQIYEALMPF
jgi:flagellar L-ring protein precursor FlgH